MSCNLQRGLILAYCWGWVYQSKIDDVPYPRKVWMYWFDKGAYEPIEDEV